MTAREKVISAQEQIKALVSQTPVPCPACEGKGCEYCLLTGEIVLGGIHCPFCGAVSTSENGILCCENMADITDALLSAMETKEQLAAVESVYERCSRMVN